MIDEPPPPVLRRRPAVAVWNTLLVAAGDDALWGAYVALGGSGIMLVGSAVARSSENAARKDRTHGHPPELPRARSLEEYE